MGGVRNSATVRLSTPYLGGRPRPTWCLLPGAPSARCASDDARSYRLHHGGSAAPRPSWRRHSTPPVPRPPDGGRGVALPPSPGARTPRSPPRRRLLPDSYRTPLPCGRCWLPAGDCRSGGRRAVLRVSQRACMGFSCPALLPVSPRPRCPPEHAVALGNAHSPQDRDHPKWQFLIPQDAILSAFP